jgi:hypothetical protein
MKRSTEPDMFTSLSHSDQPKTKFTANDSGLGGSGEGRGIIKAALLYIWYPSNVDIQFITLYAYVNPSL